MSDTTNKSSRRDVLKTIGGVLGGVSLLGHGTARGQALGSMPNGYTFLPRPQRQRRRSIRRNPEPRWAISQAL